MTLQSSKMILLERYFAYLVIYRKPMQALSDKKEESRNVISSYRFLDGACS